FIAWAKSRGGKQVNLANNSAIVKLMMNVLAEKTGLPWIEIPYKGTADAVLSVMSAQSDFHFLTIADPLIAQNKDKLQVLAIASETRNKNYPEVPTVNEAVPGFYFNAWAGITTRAKTPQPVIDRLFREFTFAMKQPDVAKRMTDLGQPPVPSSSPEEFSQ